MKREMERKEQERKKSQKVEFVSGGNQPATVAAPKINIPLPGEYTRSFHGTGELIMIGKFFQFYLDSSFWYGAVLIEFYGAGVPSTAIGGLSSASTAVDTATRDGRQNKKSKWDKVHVFAIDLCVLSRMYWCC